MPRFLHFAIKGFKIFLAMKGALVYPYGSLGKAILTLLGIVTSAEQIRATDHMIVRDLNLYL